MADDYDDGNIDVSGGNVSDVGSGYGSLPTDLSKYGVFLPATPQNTGDTDYDNLANQNQDTQKYADNDPRKIISETAQTLNSLGPMPTNIPAAPVMPASGLVGSKAEAIALRNQQTEHDKAIQDVQRYVQTAKMLHDAQHDAEVKVQAGNFLQDYSNLDPNSPTFRQDTNDLLQQHAGAILAPEVQHSVNLKMAANDAAEKLRKASGTEDLQYQNTLRRVAFHGIKTGLASADEINSIGQAAQNWTPGTPVPEGVAIGPNGKARIDVNALSDVLATRQAQGMAIKTPAQQEAEYHDAVQTHKALIDDDNVVKALRGEPAAMQSSTWLQFKHASDILYNKAKYGQNTAPPTTTPAAPAAGQPAAAAGAASFIP